MRELIPRQLFEVAIQARLAAASSHAVRQGAAQERAREVHGGASRKRKPREAERGQKRMKRVGRWKSRRSVSCRLKVGQDS
jgi:translation elongation factor EF-4